MRPKRQILALAVLCAMSLVGTAQAATFVVSTTADSGPGSLREALASAGLANDADDVSFDVGSPGAPATITLTSLLPNIVFPVTIDGTTSPAGRVVVTGSAVTNGFTIAGSGVTIRGLVVNGFTSAQIRISSGSGNVIEGNYVGPNAAGTASASPTTSSGIAISNSGGNRIGGWTAAERNLISGNGSGIFFSGTYATPNVVVGNWIGTDATGLAPLENSSHGIEDFLGSPNTIGGTDDGAGNVISGNGLDGISLGLSGTTGYVVQGNLIGVGADDLTPVGNGRHGVRFLSHMTNALVGGPAPNHVAYNGSAGVLLAVTADGGNAILGNSIHDNGALGIDINGSGVNANDPGDADTGSNDGQNYPVLDATFAGGTEIDVTLDGKPNTTFTIELFASTACDATGFGEAEELVGSYVVPTDGTGQLAFTATLLRAIAPSEFVTATATDSAGSTSELSRCAPSPFPTTTTSTSTSSSSTATVTTSSSTTVPTTSSTSTTEEPTTSSSSTTVETTSSTSSSTLSPESTTTTTTTPENETTTTTLGIPPTTAVPTTSSTSTSTLAGDSTTSTSTLPVETTTSTSTLPADTTTSTSTLPGETTTSTSTLPGETTTSTSTLPVPTTTSTSTLPDETTTSTSTLPADTTSTTAGPTTSSTSSSTLVGDTTTSTSTLPAETTTTTSTLPAETTTTSSSPESTTTSTTLPEETTTTSSPSSTSTTDTSPVTTSSTSSTTLLAASTSTSTTTTLRRASTTSTTLVSEPGCSREVAFVPLRCRLVDLTTTIGVAPELTPMRPKLGKHLAKARRLLDKAEARCQLTKRGPAKRSLRMVRKQLKVVGKALLGKPVRRTVPPAVTDPLARTTAALGTDVRTLATSMVCE